MALYLHFSVGFVHYARFIYQESSPLSTHECPPVQTSLLPDTVQVKNPSFWITEQSERQTMLFLELLMGLDAVFAYPKDYRVLLAEFLCQIPKLLRLLRTSGRSVLRIEVQDHLLPQIVAQRNLFAFV